MTAGPAAPVRIPGGGAGKLQPRVECILTHVVRGLHRTTISPSRTSRSRPASPPGRSACGSSATASRRPSAPRVGLPALLRRTTSSALRRVQAYRHRGLSVPAAIERARGDRRRERPPVDLRRRRRRPTTAPARRCCASRRSSRSRGAIEHETLAHAARADALRRLPARGVLPRGRAALPAHGAAQADAAAVVRGLRRRSAHPEGGPVEIPIGAERRAGQRVGGRRSTRPATPPACWPGSSRASPSPAAPTTRDRRFEAIWTLDPRATRRAAEVAARLAARADPEYGERLERPAVGPAAGDRGARAGADRADQPRRLLPRAATLDRLDLDLAARRQLALAARGRSPAPSAPSIDESSCEPCGPVARWPRRRPAVTRTHSSRSGWRGRGSVVRARRRRGGAARALQRGERRAREQQERDHRRAPDCPAARRRACPSGATPNQIGRPGAAPRARSTSRTPSAASAGLTWSCGPTDTPPESTSTSARVQRRRRSPWSSRARCRARRPARPPWLRPGRRARRASSRWSCRARRAAVGCPAPRARRRSTGPRPRAGERSAASRGRR